MFSDFKMCYLLVFTVLSTGYSEINVQKFKYVDKKYEGSYKLESFKDKHFGNAHFFRQFTERHSNNIHFFQC